MAHTYSSTTVFELRLRPSQSQDSRFGPLHKKLVGMTAKKISNKAVLWTDVMKGTNGSLCLLDRASLW